MKWYRDLYLGEGIKKSPKQLIQKVETNAGLGNMYLVTIAANGRDLFDIFSTNLLFQPVLHGHCPLIVGMAKSHEDAVSIAVQITMEAYQQYGDFDIYRYLESRLDESEEMIYEYPMEKLKKRKRFKFRK